MTYTERLREFILENTPLESLEDEEDIFDTGAVNSMFVMQLVAYVEGTTGVVVQNTDLTFDNFRSLVAIDRLVSARTGDGVGS